MFTVNRENLSSRIKLYYELYHRLARPATSNTNNDYRNGNAYVTNADVALLSK